MPPEPETPRQAPELVPLEAHIIALRAELERTQAAIRVATAALALAALALLWQGVRAGSPRLAGK